MHTLTDAASKKVIVASSVRVQAKLNSAQKPPAGVVDADIFRKIKIRITAETSSPAGKIQ